MKRLLKEPLLHFLLLGAAVFAVYSLVPRRGEAGPGAIVVTQGQVEHLANGFAKTWMRPPTPEELMGLIRDYVREEVYCREAMALGLDKDDTVVRRRLRQKMEFISEGIAARVEPTDAELDAYLQAHADAFRVEPKYTFQQVYLNPQTRGEKLPQDVARMLAQLNGGEGSIAPASMGDALMLDSEIADAPKAEIAKRFGDTFAAQLVGLTTGRWQGPVESGYGVHLVKVSGISDGRVPALGEVRDAVRREWDNARRLEANEKFYGTLLKRYTVTIESPESGAGSKAMAKAP